MKLCVLPLFTHTETSFAEMEQNDPEKLMSLSERQPWRGTEHAGALSWSQWVPQPELTVHFLFYFLFLHALFVINAFK